jgi:hypothetical protein
MYKTCRVIGCKNPTRAGTEDGLDRRFCRSQAEHYARHGSPYVRSYQASEINPYRRAAADWLLIHDSDRWVQNAIQRVDSLYRRAGPYVEAFRLRGKSPRQRANAAWARLRKHHINPRLVVAAWLAVEAISRDLPGAETKQEFKRVQGAKIIHRMASGSHKKWGGHAAATELHVYPASRGQVLRYLGADLEGAVELLAERSLNGVLANKRKRDERKTIEKRAHPRSLSVRSRSGTHG